MQLLILIYVERQIFCATLLHKKLINNMLERSIKMIIIKYKYKMEPVSITICIVLGVLIVIGALYVGSKMFLGWCLSRAL